MEFSQEVIQEMNAYVVDNKLQESISVKPDGVTMLSEDSEQRFEARISPASGSNNETFCVCMQDTSHKTRELEFSYGLPFTATLDNTWTPREVLCYIRSMLNDCIVLCESLHKFITSARQLSCHCFEINRGFEQLGVYPISVASEIANVAALAASPRKKVSVYLKEVPNDK